jgi:hypothetical protein
MLSMALAAAFFGGLVDVGPYGEVRMVDASIFRG